MNADEDIAAALPQSPPPVPVRRDAAIADAMRVFDGEARAPRVSRGRHQEAIFARWSNRLGRAQFAALVSAALLAVVALPLAWIGTGDGTRIENIPGVTAMPRDDARTGRNVADNHPGVPVSGAPKQVPDLAAVAKETAPASPAEAPPPVELARADAPPPPPVVAYETLAKPAAPAQTAASDRGAAFADTRDAAVVVTARRAERRSVTQEDLSSIVVTGAKRSRAPARGDWNACTVNDPKQSLKSCKKVLRIGAKGATGLAAAHMAEGLSRAWQGDDDGAVAEFDQAIAIAPRSAIAYLNRGLAQGRMGKLGQATADLDRAVQISPTARGYYNRSLLRRQAGDERRARADRERAVDLDPGYADVAEQK